MLYDKLELEADEKVIKIVRKHWFVITMEMLAVVFVGFLPVIGCILILNLPFSLPLISMFSEQMPIIAYLLSIWLLMTVMAGAVTWTSYFLDLWVITDRRIIIIDQIGFFNRKVSNFRLERLQDIKVTVRGFIPTILDYGTIRAQTASASENNFESFNLPDPRGLQSLIQNAMDARLGAFKDNDLPGLE